MVMEKKWACGHCKSVHDTESEADQCCPAEEVWACSECGDWTDVEQDFCNACKNKA